MLEFEYLTADTDRLLLEGGKYRLSWHADKMGIALLQQDLEDGRRRNQWHSDYRQGVTRPVELGPGDYRIVLM
jgi:hypothetical protein